MTMTTEASPQEPLSQVKRTGQALLSGTVVPLTFDSTSLVSSHIAAISWRFAPCPCSSPNAVDIFMITVFVLSSLDTQSVRSMRLI